MRQLNIKIDIDLNNELTEWCNRAKQVKSNIIAIAIRKFLVSSTADTLMYMVNPPKTPKTVQPATIPIPIDIDDDDLGAPSDDSDDAINF